MAISSQEGLSQREQQVCRLVSCSSMVVLKLMRRRLPAVWDRLPASVLHIWILSAIIIRVRVYPLVPPLLQVLNQYPRALDVLASAVPAKS